MGGSNAANSTGTFGTKGIPAPANIPAGRSEAVSWIDSSGNLWLFGGGIAPTSTTDVFFNDLWRYNAGQWTWMSGSTAANQPGIYGTLGTPSPDNVPGARVDAVGWADKSGDLWLFGGTAFDSTGATRFLNDLWKYSAGQWTWMGGSSVGLPWVAGVYGTQGISAPANVPGGRSGAVAWTDSAGSFWLFGGTGVDSAGNIGYLNDLWKYNAGQWTWISGSNLANPPGNYGVKGVAAPGNVPSPKIEATGWTDSSGNLWLFGGARGPQGQFGALNDLWRFSGGQWTWIAGSSLDTQPGTYGTKGVADANDTPGSRVAAAAWTDASGNFWLFGGNGYDSFNSVGDLGDLWKFSAGQWTWVAGASRIEPAGSYGTQGVAAPGNSPGGRYWPSSWVDSAGKLWLFGGRGYDAGGNSGFLNDLWSYTPQ